MIFLGCAYFFCFRGLASSFFYSNTTALLSARASATFLLADERILCTVPLDTPILLPASSCVRSSRSQSFSASSSSRKRVIRSTSDIETPVGLKAFPLNRHPQSLCFLHRGTCYPPYCVHMHTIIQVRCRIVKSFMHPEITVKLFTILPSCRMTKSGTYHDGAKTLAKSMSALVCRIEQTV